MWTKIRFKLSFDSQQKWNNEKETTIIIKFETLFGTRQNTLKSQNAINKDILKEKGDDELNYVGQGENTKIKITHKVKCGHSNHRSKSNATIKNR